MKRCLIALITLILAAPAAAQVDTLAPAIDDLLARPSLQLPIWGIRIEAADGTVLYDRNSSTLLAPASNRKLAVAAFAAHCLGVDTQLQTGIRITGPVRNGVLHGDIVVVGDGDPSLGGRFDFDRDVTLEPIVEALAQRGVREIRGGVVADVSMFADDLIPGSWKNDNLTESYAAPVDALAWNENVVGFRAEIGPCPAARTSLTTDPHFVTGEVEVHCSGESRQLRYRMDDSNTLRVRSEGPSDSYPRVDMELVAVDDPALYVAQSVDDRLRRAGLMLARGPRVSREPVPGESIATIPSPTVGVLLAAVLEVSQNLYAEMMLKRAAATVAEVPVDYDAALQAEEAFLRSIGVDVDQVRFLDGSGLSPDDLVTNRALISIVRWMAQPPQEGFFRQILARPQGEGTLRNRLAGYESRIAGKTGTINTVAALSGWADTKSGERRFFSVIVNHHTTSSREVRETIDAIARMVADVE